ncbi:iron ABC transporter permease [Salipaludibacillus sp. CUR1]|uniref:FecCD family ABC transporter permease n=1 Tax=Salipaludibacillus sp. CUR1 TaxID=2820003 RepID=UPI001E62EF4E|nr:iron ABC transporter permease [Salipaludibacillus sp. CUR1]
MKLTYAKESPPVERGDHYFFETKKKIFQLTVLFLCLIGTIVLSVRLGTVSMTVAEQASMVLQLLTGEAFSTNSYIVFHIRLPRIVMAIITGMALACAGVIMQALLRNPLASPFTLGVSSGAAFGAALAIVLGAGVFGINVVTGGQWLIAANAFIFGCLAVFAVYGIAQIRKGSTTVLLLAGVAIGQLFSAGVSAIQYFSSNAALKDLIVWLMGGFWGAEWQVIQFLLPLTVIVFLFLWKLSWDLNTLSSGEEVASSLGVNVRRLRLTALVLSTLLASSTIAFTGIIGFIGLVAPHISRMIIGTDNRFLLPCSCLIGAILLLLSDTVARTVLSPVEIPVGIITSLLGAPFFIYLLLRKQKDYWS